MRKCSTSDLLDEIRRLSEEFGHPPTLQEVRDYGKYAATTYYLRFGSWQNALEAAGFPSREPNAEIPEDDLIQGLQRVAKISTTASSSVTGKKQNDYIPPTAAEMNQYGSYWASTYRRRFGSWNAALEAAGFEPRETEVTDEDLLTELWELADKLEKTPTYTEMNNQGKHGSRTYVRRFGSWNAALETAGLDSRSSSTISDDELIAELRRLADELERQPSARDMDEYGEYASATYQRHFGSWSATLETAFAHLDTS